MRDRVNRTRCQMTNSVAGCGRELARYFKICIT